MKLKDYYQKGRYKKKEQEERLPYYTARTDLLKKLIRDFHPKKILDVGCGDGGMALMLKNRYSAEVYGVDISKKGIMLAKRKGIKAVVADANKRLPFKTSTFDLIITNEVIEHVFNPDEFILDLKRLLNKKGVLVIGTPNLTFWLNRILFLFGVYPMFLEASTRYRNIGTKFMTSFVDEQPVGHVHVFSNKALVDLLKRYSFQILEAKSHPVDFRTSNTIVNLIYRAVDLLFSNFPELGADCIVVARKK